MNYFKIALLLVFVFGKISVVAQQLVEEAYDQRIIDAFHDRNNCLSTVLPTLATNFNFRIEQTALADGKVKSQIQLRVGASGKRGYIILTDKAGVPYCFVKENLYLFYDIKKPGKFTANFSGNNRFRFNVLEDSTLEYVVQYNDKSIISEPEVTINLSRTFYNALKTTKKTTFNKPTETLTLEMEKSRVLRLVFGKGSEEKPIKMNGIQLESTAFLLKFDNFEFDSSQNKKLVNLEKADLDKAGIIYHSTEMSDLEFSFNAPEEKDWSAEAKANALKLKKLIETN
jgi:hypothetical protein